MIRMRNIVFVAPFPMDATLRFAKGFARLENVRVFGVFQKPPMSERGRTFDDLVAVEDALDPDEIVSAVRRIEAVYGPTHRLTVLSTYNNDRYRPGLNTFCWRTLQLLPDQPLHD